MLLYLRQLPGWVIASGVFGLLILYTIIGAIVNYRKLSQFKGPRLAGFTRGWIMWQSLRDRLNIAEFEAVRKYGPVTRIGPDLLITDDPDILRHISAARSRWSRSLWYTANKIDPRRDNVFSTQNEKLHTELRAKMIAAYNNKDIDSYEVGMDERITELMDLIRTQYHNKPLDMAPVALFFTLDTLSTLAFGSPFGFVKANKDIWDYFNTLRAFAPIAELCGNHHNILYIMMSRVMQRMFAPRGSDHAGIGPILGFAQHHVAERFGPDPKIKHDMLGYMVQKGMPQEQIEVEASLQIIAGSDSTATILRTALYQLIGNPPAYAKLRAEVDAAVTDGRISYPVVTYAEAQELPYLMACLWEGLRMHPPLIGLLSKIAPQGGEEINGYFFPEGTEVAICPAAVTRRRDVFGETADIYHPDRWIEATKEQKEQMERCTELIFGTGRYVCLGKTIAFTELTKTIVELIRHFDWQIAHPLKGIDSINHGVFLQKNMWLMAWPRS